MLPTFQILNGNLYQIKPQKVLNNIIKYNTSFQDLKLRIDNEKALAEAAKKQQDELFTLQKELLLQQIANARQEGHNQQQLFLKKAGSLMLAGKSGGSSLMEMTMLCSVIAAAVNLGFQRNALLLFSLSSKPCWNVTEPHSQRGLLW